MTIQKMFLSFNKNNANRDLFNTGFMKPAAFKTHGYNSLTYRGNTF